MFRLKIDIPLGEDEILAVTNSKLFIEAFLSNVLNWKKYGFSFPDVKEVQYLLANDSDRTARNYLDKDENGHVSTKKIKVKIE
jgi:hypothetical protein